MKISKLTLQAMIVVAGFGFAGNAATAAPVTFDLTKSPVTSGATGSFTAGTGPGLINLTITPSGPGTTPVWQANPRGTCAYNSFGAITGGTSATQFCGQAIDGTQPLTQLSFKFDKNVKLVSFTATEGNFGEPSGGDGGAGSGYVFYTPSFVASNGTFQSDIAFKTDRTTSSTTFTSTSTTQTLAGYTNSCSYTAINASFDSCSVQVTGDYSILASGALSLQLNRYSALDNSLNSVTPTGLHWRISSITVEQFDQPVPGPLPILGAAAAFAKSRQIRRRIKKMATT